MNRSLRCVVRLVAISLAVFLAGSSLAEAQGISFRGWGPRFGISSDPDQVVVGAHWDLGEFTKNLRFQPTVQLGYGDNQWLVSAAAGALYFFPVDGDWKPYAGGELGIVYQNFDGKKGNDTGIALNAVGGVETGLKKGRRFLMELKLGITEDPKIQVLVGWTF